MQHPVLVSIISHCDYFSVSLFNFNDHFYDCALKPKAHINRKPNTRLIVDDKLFTIHWLSISCKLYMCIRCPHSLDQLLVFRFAIVMIIKSYSSCGKTASVCQLMEHCRMVAHRRPALTRNNKVRFLWGRSSTKSSSQSDKCRFGVSRSVKDSWKCLIYSICLHQCCAKDYLTLSRCSSASYWMHTKHPIHISDGDSARCGSGWDVSWIDPRHDATESFNPVFVGKSKKRAKLRDRRLERNSIAGRIICV